MEDKREDNSFYNSLDTSINCPRCWSIERVVDTAVRCAASRGSVV